MTAPGRDGGDPLAALERLLLKHKVITEEQALAAARLISRDPQLVFPRPAPPAAPAEDASVPGSETP